MQVGELVDTAYALWLQDEVDSAGESTVTEEDSSTEACEDTKVLSRENCTEACTVESVLEPST